MTLEAWIAFVVASAILLVIPGPTILLVISYALGQGWRAAVPTAIGVALGDFTAMTLSVIGIGALLSASATLFTVLKLAGAAYLIWLGVKLWRSGTSMHTDARTDPASALSMLGHAWLVTALNPKSITFFIAFMPQFLSTSGDFVTQVIVAEATFLVLAFANAFVYAFVAAKTRSAIGDERIVGAINKAGGGLLISMGLLAAILDSRHA